MSSTSASAERLIMALVTTPDCPSAAPRASPGKMYLSVAENVFKYHKLMNIFTIIPFTNETIAEIKRGNILTDSLGHLIEKVEMHYDLSKIEIWPFWRLEITAHYI